MYDIVFTKQADRALRKMPRNVAKRIRSKLDDLAMDPYGPNHAVTRLQGRSGYRLRVGDWRIIYELEDDILRIVVMKVAPRGEVYR